MSATEAGTTGSTPRELEVETGPMVAAWVDGEPILADHVAERLAQLRARDRASAVPPADSREGRQLRRWVTQVAVVERICELEVTRTRYASPNTADPADVADPADPVPWVERADALAAGSIVAAAWAGHPDVGRAAALVTAGVTLPEAARARAARLTALPQGGAVWDDDELLRAARMEVFGRWLAKQTHDRVRLAPGYEHPGDAAQPDNRHEH